MSLKIITIYLLFLSSLYSTIIEFNEKDIKKSILEKSSFYIDPQSTLKFEDIKTKEFQKSDTNQIHLGMTSATVWIQFSLKNSSLKPLQRYITVTNPLHDTIELYTKQQDGSFHKQTQGMCHIEEYEKNNLLYPSFKIDFNIGEIKEFYLKAHSLSSANYFKLLLKDQIQLYKDEFSYQLIEALFFGAMIALILYNIFILIFTREVAYLYYILLITVATINYCSYSAMISYFTQNQMLLDIDAYLGLYYLSIANVFALLFIDKILNIDRFKYLHKINLILIVGSVLLMIVSIKIDSLFEVSMFYLLLCMLYIFCLIVFALYKKTAVAKYILIGWSISIIGIFSLALNQYAIPNPIEYFPYFYELTSFLEAVLFSIALSAKLNKAKEVENSLKTNQLITKELHHRVKNNMQFIILLYRLKLSNIKNEELDKKLQEIECSIQAISKTHEILYQHNELNILDTQVYFKNLLEEITNSYDTSKIKISLVVNTTLPSNQLIFCGIILNELLTNVFKYAFRDNIGTIEISLTKQENQNEFIVEDDGVGFDYEKIPNESFGLSFIENIVKDELQGSCNINVNKGTKVQIIFN